MEFLTLIFVLALGAYAKRVDTSVEAEASEPLNCLASILLSLEPVPGAYRLGLAKHTRSPVSNSGFTGPLAVAQQDELMKARLRTAWMAVNDEGSEPNEDGVGDLSEILDSVLGESRVDVGKLSEDPEFKKVEEESLRKARMSLDSLQTELDEQFAKALKQTNAKSLYEEAGYTESQEVMPLDDLSDFIQDFLEESDIAAATPTRRSKVNEATTTILEQDLAGTTARFAGKDALCLGDGAVIAVAGHATPLGQLVMQALPGAGKDWTVRELGLSAPRESFRGIDAVIIISDAVGGKEGIKSSEVKALTSKIGDGVRRFVMASIRGVDDTSMFSMANILGQLDKQRYAEEEMVLNALARRPSKKDVDDGDDNKIMSPGFSVVRFGKLIDDRDIAPVSGVVGPPKSRDQLALGDASEGDVLMSTAAAFLIEALKQPTNAKFSLGKADAKAGVVRDDQIYWDDQFLKLVGPEIFRKPFTGDSIGMVTRLQNWALKFQKGKGLTSPAVLSEVDNGFLLQFQTRDKKRNDGALLFIADADPSPRVRVVRTGMDEREDIQIKLMSEETLIRELDGFVN